MGSLWASDDVTTWRESLADVGKRLEALENPKLTELERQTHRPEAYRDHSAAMTCTKQPPVRPVYKDR